MGIMAIRGAVVELPPKRKRVGAERVLAIEVGRNKITVMRTKSRRYWIKHYRSGALVDSRPENGRSKALGAAFDLAFELGLLSRAAFMAAATKTAVARHHARRVA